MSSVNIKDLIGCPYKIHGRSKEEGFDCYGLDVEFFKRDGINLPDVDYSKPEQYEDVFLKLLDTVEYEKIDFPQEKCIIVFNIRNEPTHTGIYIGDGLFIHSTKDKGVIVEPLHRWECRVKGYYKVSNSRSNQKSV